MNPFLAFVLGAVTVVAIIALWRATRPTPERKPEYSDEAY